jgi:hypothetical protein
MMNRNDQLRSVDRFGQPEHPRSRTEAGLSAEAIGSPVSGMIVSSRRKP